MDAHRVSALRAALAELERAAAESTRLTDIESRAGWRRRDLNELSDDDQAVSLALSAAFQYLSKHGNQKVDDSPFISMVVLDDGTHIPPRPAEAPEDWARVWSDALMDATHPAVRARLGDLLFVRRKGDVGLYARVASEAYLKFSQLSDWENLDKSHALLRAYDIATRAKLEATKIDVLNRMASFAHEALSTGSGPGTVLDVIATLLNNSDYSDVGNELIDKAAQRYSDPNIGEQVLLIKRSATRSPEDRRDIDVRRVHNWLQAAEANTGVVRLMHLESAARIAEASGLSDLRETAVRLLQQTDPDELGLQKMRHSVDIPADVVEDYLTRFVIAEDWRESLHAVALHEPLTGALDDNIELLEEIRRRAPISSILRRVRLGGDGLPRWSPQSDEDDEDLRLAERETSRLQITAPLFAEGLSRLGSHYEIRDSDLFEYLNDRPSSNISIAQSLTTAYRLYWEERYTASAMTGIWQIEAISRHILLAADSAVYVTQRKSSQARYVSLGYLIKQLARLGIDPSWYRYLWTVFVSPAGLNLRNEVAHGFISDVSKPYAAIILHAASYLTLIRTTQSEFNDSTQ